MPAGRRSPRFIRWAQELSRYNFRIDYRQGKRNPADGLSRPPTAGDDDGEVLVENRKTLHLLQTSLADKKARVCLMRAMSGESLDDASGPTGSHHGEI